MAHEQFPLHPTSASGESNAQPVTTDTPAPAEYKLDDTGFTCNTCGSASGFSGRALHDDLLSHGVTRYTADLCQVASLYLTSRLKRVAAGILCLLCNNFLPKATFASFRNHCKKVHNATLSGAEVERAFEAVLASTIQEVPTPVAAKAERYLPCVVAHCDYVAWVEGAEETAAYDRLSRHIANTHNVTTTTATEHASKQQIETGYRKGRNTVACEVQHRAHCVELGDLQGQPAGTAFSVAELGVGQTAVLRSLLPQTDADLDQGIRSAVEIVTMRAFPANALSAAAREEAPPLYKYLRWYQDPSFYALLAGNESLVHLFAQAHLMREGCPEMVAFFNLAFFTVEVFISTAKALRAVSPAFVRECLGGAEYAALSADEAEFARLVDRMFLAHLTEGTKRTYAQGFCHFLVWLSTRKRVELLRAPFDPQLMERVAAQDHEALKEAATRLIQELAALEWSRECALGTFTQFLMSYCLDDSRPIGQRNGLPLLSQLRLRTLKEMLPQAKVLRYVTRGVVLVKRFTAIRAGMPEKSLPVSSAKSMPTLNGIIAFARAMHKDEAGRSDVALDLLHSEAHGTPHVRVILPTGVDYISLDVLARGCTKIEGVVMESLRGILLDMRAPVHILQAVADPVAARISFGMLPQQQHLCHLQLNGEDLGDTIHVLATAYLASASPHDIARVVKVLRVIQEQLWWLLLVGSGADMRSTDSWALIVGGRCPESDRVVDTIYTHSEFDLHIVSRPSKTTHLGIPGLSYCKVDYKTGVYMSVFTLLKDIVGERRTPFTLNTHIWFEDFAKEGSRRPVASFPVTSLKAIGMSLTLQVFRQVVPRLCTAAAKELNNLCKDICEAGGISMASFAADKSSAGTVDISVVFTQAAGHTEETELVAYGGNEIYMRLFELGFIVMQRRLRGSACHPQSKVAQEQHRAKRTFMSPSEAKARALDLLKRVYPAATGYRCQAQEQIAIDVLSAEEDMIWIAACGEGKSIALLLAALMCAEQGKVTIVISPQRNVTLSLKAQLDEAGLSSRIFTGGEEDMDICAGDAFAAAPAFSVLFISIEALARSKLAWAAIEAMGRFDRLAMIFADEIHLHLSSPSFRDAFGRAGDLRARMGRRARFFACTATLALNAEPALMEQLLLVPSQTIVRRSGTLLGGRFSFRVEDAIGEAGHERLLQFVSEWAEKYAKDKRVGRMVVLVTSVDKAHQLRATMEEMLKKSSASGVNKLRVGSATGEDSLEHVNEVINTSDIVFCTTFLCTSANMTNLRHAIIFQTAFSLADLVQFLGRLAREVGAGIATAVFLFDRQLHNQLFGLPPSRLSKQKDTEVVLACFADDTDGARLQLAPSYVARLAARAHTSCVMEELNSVFVRAGSGACKDMHGGEVDLYCGHCAQKASTRTSSPDHHEDERLEQDDLHYMDEEEDEPDMSAHHAGPAAASADPRDEEDAFSSDELDDEASHTIAVALEHTRVAPRYTLGDPGTAKGGAQRRLGFSSTASSGHAATPVRQMPSVRAMDTRVEETPHAASKRPLPQDQDDLLLDNRVAPLVTIPSATSAPVAASPPSGPTSTATSRVQPQSIPKDPFVKVAEIHMHRILDAYQRLVEAVDASGKLACLGCKDLACNGFRLNGDLCPALGRKKGLVCYKCGAAHSACKRKWQTLAGRCKFCFMPWDEILGCTFHYGGAGKDKSTLSQAPVACLAIGDCFKASLARLWRSNDAAWRAFCSDVQHHCTSPLPTRGDDIDPFILWLSRPAVWGNGMFHIDLAVEYVLTRP